MEKPRLLRTTPVGNITKPGKQSRPDLEVLSHRGKIPPLTADQLAASITRILAYGTVRESYHSREERAVRNISDDDLQYGLQLSWILVGEPNWDVQHKNWEYLIRTKDIDGEDLHIKLVVDLEFDRIRIITKY